MKAVILVALFAFVAQASLLDTADYTNGFANQLGLDSVEISTGIQCFSSLNDTVQAIQSIIQSIDYGVEDVAFEAMNLIAVVDGPLKENCQDYIQDLIVYVANASNTTDGQDLKFTVQYNADKYSAQLIQQATNWVDAILSNNEYEAGQIEAYILQILVGAATPEQIIYPNLTYADYVPMNYTQMIVDFYGTFFANYGYVDNTATDAFLECYNNVTVAVPIVQNFVNSFEQASGLEKIDVVRTAFDDLSFAVEGCLPALGLSVGVYVPVIEAIKENPVQAILTIIHNVASHLPELEQSQIDSGADMFTGNYTEAAQETVFQYNTVFANAGY